LSVLGYLIVKAKHADHLFDGEGAFLYGGRWNSSGQRMVYCAGSKSLAILEMLVHLDDHLLVSHYVIAEVEIPESLIETAIINDLPENWSESPVPNSSQNVGDEWIEESRSAVLAVPSAIVGSESNYLLNPCHSDFHKIKFGDPQAFEFDTRLLKAVGKKAPKTRTTTSKKKKP
jgi:RES domain-containing protein